MTPDEIAANYFKHLQHADLLIEVGRWREALNELDQHLLSYADDYHALCQSALCRLELGEYQAAYDLTKRAIEASPQTEWAYRLQSLIFSANGEGKRALEAAERCVEKAPNLPFSLQTLVYAQAGYGQHENAEKTLEAFLKVSPGGVESHEAAGYVALKKEEYLAAEKHYLAALKIQPDSVNALNNLGVAYLELANQGKGEHYRQKSVEMFDRAVKTQPTFKMAHDNINAAKFVAKAGAPVGLIIALIIGLNSLSQSARSVASPPNIRDAIRALGLLTPYSASPVLFALNIYFCLILVAACTIGVLYVIPSKRPSLVTRFDLPQTWIAVLVSLGLPMVLYSLLLLILELDGSPFAWLALVVSVILVFIAVLRLVSVRRPRRSESV